MSGFIKHCQTCKNEFKSSRRSRRFCSRKCCGQYPEHKERKRIQLLLHPIRPDYPISRPWDGGTRPDFTGSKHPMWGKKHTPETIEKIKAKRAMQGRMNVGENHWNWQGGISSLRKRIYVTYKYKNWRSSIFGRDKSKCVQCGSKDPKAEVHHKKPFTVILRHNKIKTVEQALECGELWDLNNGEVLCLKCHEKTDSYGNKALNFV